MRLKNEELKNVSQWTHAGFQIPSYDREQIEINTKNNPTWIHFGTGNLFRAFPANIQHTILENRRADKGIIAVSGINYHVISQLFQPHDNLTVLVTLKADGTIEKSVIGSIMESITLDSQNEIHWSRLKEIFSAPSLQLASLTITEKGYSLMNSKKEYYPDVREDFQNGPAAPLNYMSKVTALLYKRFKQGEYPIAMVSMDNCSHNGTKLKESICTIAKMWVKNSLTEPEFEDYLNNINKVSYPWTMIDKITPRTDENVRKLLKDAGLEDVNDIKTGRNSVAPFVNAEETGYLVIEDDFPNGRPNLEEGGVIFTDRETVDKVEKMKVCTCLNPLHTTLAIFGCLLDYTLIAKEMEDPHLKSLVERIGYQEGLPVVINPGIMNPKAFIDTVLNIRIPNPFINDTPQRIAEDTSQKMAIRFGETIKAYEKRTDLKASQLTYIPFVIAGWCRYLMGINDRGEEMNISPDPLLEELTPYVRDISLGDKGPFHKQLQPILSNPNIFGIDLYKAGLGEKIENYFQELVSDIGAVRETLSKYL